MESVRDLLEGDQFAEYCGLNLVSVGEGRAVVRMDIKPFHLNGNGVVHGGAIFTLADYAFAAASNSAAMASVSINASISYIKAGKGQGALTAEARPLTTNTKLGTYLVEIKNDEGVVIAAFQGLSYKVR
jgi:acyl-CoA thioesterase